ncbi:MAG TPA: 16S rRNA (guanine(966)-N(2))-methyltransferase RsmD [bacterium]|nr:16S rRNA (guanine(966)-N(2))-methyltransferase RsmD [bacterium]
MRVIGGKFKRSNLIGPGRKNMSIRATYDRVRENVFNLIGPMEGKSFLDLYGGSGSVGIEALSRGARTAVFVDNQPESVRLIRKNLESLNISDRADVIRMDVRSYLRQPPRPERFDVVFIDPPYNTDLFEETMRLLGRGNLLAIDAKIIGQHGKSPEKMEIVSFTCNDLRKYGRSWVSLWSYKQKG